MSITRPDSGTTVTAVNSSKTAIVDAVSETALTEKQISLKSLIALRMIEIHLAEITGLEILESDIEDTL